MNKILIAGAASLMTIAVASAQTTTPTTPTPGTGTTGFGTKGAGTPGAGTPGTAASGEQTKPPAMTGSADAPAGDAAKGANSFTQAQAEGRIADAGYASVSNLKKDDNGVWHGTAMKNGQQVSVWVDFKGKVGQS